MTAPGCGGSDDDRDCATADVQGGTSYTVAPPAAAGDTARAICERARALGIDAEAEDVGGGRIVLAASPEHQRQLTRPARIRLLDWEANVLSNPDAASSARATPFNGREAAARFAERERRQGPLLLLRAQDETQPPAGSGAPEQYFVVKDDAAITGKEIRDPKVDQDPTTNNPAVTFVFTDRGNRAFKEMTRAVALRGSQLGTPQNFAIALDDQIVSLAYIDPQRYPEGIDGSRGAQINLASEDEAKRIAALLGLGPLPGTLTPAP